MLKKNYLTKAELNLWQYIKSKDIIDTELIKNVFPELPTQSKNKILSSLAKKGYLNRAQNDIYYNPTLINFYKLALRIHEGYIGLNSALRHYNLIEYEDFTITVITRNVRKRLQLQGTKYTINYLPFNDLYTGATEENGLYVSSIEKTFFDCFLKPATVGFSTLTKALAEASLDWKQFLEFFRMTRNTALCQRTGYILELVSTLHHVPQYVLNHLHREIKHPVKLTASGGKSTFNGYWLVQDNIGRDHILAWAKA